MWNLPDQGSNPCPLNWQADSWRHSWKYTMENKKEGAAFCSRWKIREGSFLFVSPSSQKPLQNLCPLLTKYSEMSHFETQPLKMFCLLGQMMWMQRQENRISWYAQIHWKGYNVGGPHWQLCYSVNRSSLIFMLLGKSSTQTILMFQPSKVSQRVFSDPTFGECRERRFLITLTQKIGILKSII